VGRRADPGRARRSLIAAHVRYRGTDGAFLELGTLAVGAEVVVDRVDGSVATYAVTSVEQFPKDEFPDERIYTFEGPTRLHLVTCGGSIDPDTGHYEDNVVVFADLVSDTRTAAGA
jgi:sortase (surface protein transpeptidase)